jgi:tripartite-type tricarboxylate transporter receptor subunit TctC
MKICHYDDGALRGRGKVRTIVRSLLILLAIVYLVSGAAPPAVAQSYPSGPITLVIPLSPGDAADVSGRLMADELGKLLKVAVIPVNRPGAGMTMGTDSVVKAKKDGYTILFTPNASVIAARILNPETVTYDPVKDLTPLGLATRTPVLLVVRSDAPYKSFREMVEFAKKNPGKVRVATVGAGSIGHFTLEMINSLTGAGLVMVPFKGGGPGIAALLGGHVEAGALSLGAVSSHLKSGAMRGIVISTQSPGFPEIPTLPQLGYAQNLPGIWFAFYAPAGVPAEVTRVLVPAIEKVVKDPAIAAKLVGLGIVQDYAPPEKLLTEIREEHRMVEEIAKKAGLVK